MSKKNIDRLLKELFEEMHPECDGNCEDCEKEPEELLKGLFEVSNLLHQAKKLEEEYKKHPSKQTLTIRVYPKRASVEYHVDKDEFRALAAKTAISAILTSIKDKKMREGIVAFACRETDTLTD